MHGENTMTETREQYLIQGRPWPEGADRFKWHLVWIVVDGERIPGSEELRALYRQRTGHDPEYVISGAGVIVAGPEEVRR